MNFKNSNEIFIENALILLTGSAAAALFATMLIILS
jgi:hypothetical protein